MQEMLPVGLLLVPSDVPLQSCTAYTLTHDAFPHLPYGTWAQVRWEIRRVIIFVMEASRSTISPCQLLNKFHLFLRDSFCLQVTIDSRGDRALVPFEPIQPFSLVHFRLTGVCLMTHNVRNSILGRTSEV